MHWIAYHDTVADRADSDVTEQETNGTSFGQGRRRTQEQTSTERASNLREASMRIRDGEEKRLKVKVSSGEGLK